MLYNSFKSTAQNIFQSTDDFIFGATYVDWVDVEEEIASAENPVIDPETTVYYIELSPRGGASFNISLGDTATTLTIRYNYLAECWCVDILDAQNEMILAGIMLVPYIDLLAAFPYEQTLIGSLILVELTTDDYKASGLLGVNTKLLWTAPGGELPI